MDASPTPAAAQPPDPDPQGVGPWNMPLTVCPTPDMAVPATHVGPADIPARPAFEDGTLGGESPQLTGPLGEGTSQVHGPHGPGSVLKRRAGWVGALERRKDRVGPPDRGDQVGQPDRKDQVGRPAGRQPGGKDQVGRRTGWKRLGTPLGILAAVTGAFAYVGTVDPNEPGHYPVCPLLELTGVFCPGCGGLRSAHAFITGDLGAAFSANAIATAGYFLFAAVWVLWLVRAWRGKPLRIALAPAWWWGVGAVLLVFTVVRNLPFGSALAP
ncbi:DUF2752 domain-containing protein [Streptomyces globisporus]|uniref:DUF2752 domain-containing protein n=1 Tax=Streptomyces globisporus TaxID=1908 RepID=UPI003625AFE1